MSVFFYYSISVGDHLLCVGKFKFTERVGGCSLASAACNLSALLSERPRSFFLASEGNTAGVERIPKSVSTVLLV